MQFEITHTTSYSYEHPAAEAYGEARLTPPRDFRVMGQRREDEVK